MTKNIRKAFTLAEVLMTLAIIGIVAAMTIPTIISKVEKEKTPNGIKKVYTAFSDALALEKMNRSPDVGLWPTPTGYYGKGNTEFETYFKPHLKVPFYYGPAMYPPTNQWGSSATTTMGVNKTFFSLLDGTNVAFRNMYSADVRAPGKYGTGSAWYYYYQRPYFMITFDINGAKSPNVRGKDVFDMNIDINGVSFYGESVCNKTAPSRADLVTACAATTANCCAALIQYDGWQIKDDYPWF